MKNIVLFEHAGSSNHGCEAIIRSTARLLDSKNVKITLASFNPQEDFKYGIDKVCKIIPCADDKKNLRYYVSRLIIKFANNYTPYFRLSFKRFLNSVNQNNLYLSTGGDNYCYETKIKGCMFFNSEIKKRKGKTVLWCASIEPNLISKDKIRKDLCNYDLIVARETITYNALEENGIKNIILCPDPAFLLEKKDVSYPKNIESRGIVGINISPLILDVSENSKLAFENYKNLITHILSNTNYVISLIPHVMWDGGNDREIIDKLYREYSYSDRIYKVGDNDCMVLKGYISKCKYFIGARTHTTIAAYSCNIPTLVVGYSVKAKGIAKDLFGTYEKYVLPVQNLKRDDELIASFKWLVENEIKIKHKLSERISTYPDKYKDVITKLNNL
ncbi:hypothetical protein IMSAGC017_01965 [Thomasclavelia cocleata]|uniref:Polysaccharide pyruvyl transferase domain-containing protein n=1 Tax=Thomasclavelia cocleata TaxID=69824 RepID=A0A829ZCV2_9FIRM|nr:polysaccharide pyruvyl transferase family protein [Thomasclavelia cocleata]GFI41919.1 hypothetical protein IMSAGC017_01965 [Thomasclavelia cocleata]